MRHGLLRAQRLHGPPDPRGSLGRPDRLLLGGDVVELPIDVGPGAVLELSEVAATVAYDGRGRAANWITSISRRTGAQLGWAGEPLVVADGADVTRCDDDRARRRGERYAPRDGRAGPYSGELGGRAPQSESSACAGSTGLFEDLVLDPRDRFGPGLSAGTASSTPCSASVLRSATPDLRPDPGSPDSSWPRETGG